AISTGDTDAVTAPIQALLWGFGRVAAMECPDRWGGLIDLPDTLSSRVLGLFVKALGLSAGEGELAIRDTGLLARRLTRAPSGHSFDQPYDVDGTVLITGGTGALGAQIARSLASAGIRHLLLLSRTGRASEGAASLESELTALGAHADIVACDAADRASLVASLDRVDSDHPLTAVIHAAGVLDDAVIETMTPAQVEQVLRPKVSAAWQLHELTKDMRLSAFILFSSVAGAIGNAGQGAYAAANAFLDALAEYRKNQGLPATAIAWGRWDSPGLGSGNTAVERALGRGGLVPMDPEIATLAFYQALSERATSVMISAIEWALFYPRVTSIHPTHLFDEIPEVAALKRMFTGRGEHAVGDAHNAYDTFAQLSAPERQRALLTLVQRHASEVLGYTDHAALDARRTFRDLGFDSLCAVQFRNRINRATGLALPPSLVFDYPTLADVVVHISSYFKHQADRPADDVMAQLQNLKSHILAAPPARLPAREVATMLRFLLTVIDQPGETSEENTTIGDASDEDLFQFINDQFGIA
ncbi:MAG: SDR family NAD(P)-dependent oxidoreductase, partial [Streptosporangiaceae bacterium]|nr:SDR family NAD(P)-dependent oxidoreductase [Streptosporangiaceae bacterium]